VGLWGGAASLCPRCPPTTACAARHDEQLSLQAESAYLPLHQRRQTLRLLRTGAAWLLQQRPKLGRATAIHETTIAGFMYKTQASGNHIRWHEARAQCRSWGMDLAYIPGARGSSVAVELWEWLVSKAGAKSYWTGLNSVAQQNRWVWADGRLLGDYTSLCIAESYPWIRCGTLWYGDFCGQHCNATSVEGFVCSKIGFFGKYWGGAGMMHVMAAAAGTSVPYIATGSQSLVCLLYAINEAACCTPPTGAPKGLWPDKNACTCLFCSLGTSSLATSRASAAAPALTAPTAVVSGCQPAIQALLLANCAVCCAGAARSMASSRC
jgi:hypothetical protein